MNKKLNTKINAVIKKIDLLIYVDFLCDEDLKKDIKKIVKNNNAYIDLLKKLENKDNIYSDSYIMKEILKRIHHSYIQDFALNEYADKVEEYKKNIVHYDIAYTQYDDVRAYLDNDYTIEDNDCTIEVQTSVDICKYQITTKYNDEIVNIDTYTKYDFDLVLCDLDFCELTSMEYLEDYLQTFISNKTKEYNVKIIETLERYITVKANNKDMAIDVARNEYHDCKHVLNEDDFKEVEFY